MDNKVEPKTNEKMSTENKDTPVARVHYPYYDKAITLSDTAKLMMSEDYRDRFVAEYAQLKIRYEKLKYLLNKWEAFDEMPKRGKQIESEREYHKALEEWLGFSPDCNQYLLRKQQAQMGELLHTLEVRAVIEDIDLRWIVIKL